MKRNFSLIAVSLFLLSNATFASTTPPIALTNPSFAPVPWHATVVNGGFGVQNLTSKTQYVQVTIEKGEISVVTFSGYLPGNCKKELNAERGPYSIICELAPNDSLQGDLDFAKIGDAVGTYQVEMAKTS